MKTDNNDNSGNLEALIAEDNIMMFNPSCVRKKSNIGKTQKKYQFDSYYFSPKELLNDIPSHSPKLVALLDKIEELDKADQQKHGRLFKHFIYSDLKSSSAGAKLLASALVSKGYHCGYRAPMIREHTEDLDNEVEDDDSDDDSDENEKPKKKLKTWGKLELLQDDELEKTKNKNFYLLTSRGVYEQSIPVIMKKQILKKYNERPDNIYGRDVRFMIMDSGYKEGIDLFDIRYIHIFEPSIVPADQKQIIGRGTRTCGQKGLDFHPRHGWTLDVFIYDLEIPEKLQSSLHDSSTAMELYMKSLNLDIRMYRFAKDLENVSIYGSVDYDLNKNIHSFSIQNTNTHSDSDNDSMNGGKKLTVSNVSPMVVEHAKVVLPNGIVIENQIENRLNYSQMREHIQESFEQFTWEKIKMENLCIENGGSNVKCSLNRLLKFNPTQNFVRNYFTPENPLKGMLLWHSVGTGKTSTAIATATTSFEKRGYTILWVTRTTLKTDIWKNMFDQVAHETIREKIINENITIPDDLKQRMKLLSKAWSIRPMSYKQFSNMISKQNALYKGLVKKNGIVDPLHKTLLIIDEAHKLYGGDLSTIEKPDMPAFHEALMNSYQVSGKDSVKLLLMTATPITHDSMELIKLLNLCKLPEQQLPSEFDKFYDEFLNEDGEFSVQGKQKYLDSIAGHISYLNRENDARQFAQPMLHNIMTPIINDATPLEKFDKKIVRQIMDSDIIELKKEIDENENKITEEMKDINKDTFASLYDKCNDIVEKSECKKIVRSHIQKLVEEAKIEMNEIKENIKELRERIHDKNMLKKEELSKIGFNMAKYENEYDKYKGSLYYQLKNKCGKNIRTISELNKHIDEYPSVTNYDKTIEKYETHIKELQDTLKSNTESYKKRIKQIQQLLKTDLNELERGVVCMTLKDERKNMRIINRNKGKETKKHIDEIKNKIKHLKTVRNKKYIKIRNTIKKSIQNEKKNEKKIEKTESLLRKTIKKQEGILANEKLKPLIEKHSDEIDKEIKKMIDKKQEKQYELNKMRDEKVAEKTRKQREKMEEKTRKQRENMEKKTRKQQEKTRKQREKMEKKIRKQNKN